VHNLSIKLYRIYACYTNITLYDVRYLYIAFGIICSFPNCSRSWNVSPADTAVHLYFYPSHSSIIDFTALKTRPG